MEKIKTLAEYQQLASRTCPDLGSYELNIFHMNVGIVTEIGEAIDPIKKKIAYNKPLDLVNVGEEIADAMWYIANKSRLFLGDLNETMWGNNLAFLDTLQDYNQEFAEELSNLRTEESKLMYASDLIYTSKPQEVLDSEDFELVGIPQVVLLYKACELLGIDFWQGLTNNITKLQVRYPEKFTNEAALNRNLDAERVELEKTSDENTEGRV